MGDSTVTARGDGRAEALFAEHLDQQRRRVDRLMAWLMGGQWVFGVVVAATLSPYAWEGRARSVHPHVLAAVVLGGLLSSLPIALALLRPGAVITRHVIAVAQMLWSALLIHLTGGRIETHFHVFGSLAFLAFYRDPYVLAPATVVVAGDHLVRQLFWPESVYGVANPAWWRFLEHAGWVVFEDVFLVFACVRGLAEAREIAAKRADLERLSEQERDKSAQLDAALREALVAMEAAEKANQVKSQFLANMSHELRTPINGVIGIAELVARTELSPRQKQYIETVRASGETLLHVVNDVLDFSKVEAGKLELRAQDVDLGRVVQSVVDLLAPQAEAKGLSLATDLAFGDAGALVGDPGRLQQVLNNLVGNAVKFTQQGRVTVRGRVTEQGADHAVVRFEVTDTGAGIAPEHLGKLFKPFSQVDGSESRHFGGTGLGLAIARQLAEMMGGAVGVVSEPGEGSTFWFTARLARPERRADGEATATATATAAAAAVVGASTERAAGGTAAAASAAPSGQGAGREIPAGARRTRLLVAEDNPVNQQVAKEMLVALGYECDVADDGRAALAMLERGAYAAVLMDCQMPGMSGYEATAELRARERDARRTPVIAVTAHAMVGDRERALAAGMDDYLAKPLTFEGLRAVVERWAGGPASGAAPKPGGRAAAAPRGDALEPGTTRSRRVAELFLAQIPKALGAIREAVDAGGDPAAVKAAAHRFKGACLSVGARRLASLCAELEGAAATAPERVAALVPELEAAAAAAKDAVDAELRAPQGGAAPEVTT